MQFSEHNHNYAKLMFNVLVLGGRAFRFWGFSDHGVTSPPRVRPHVDRKWHTTNISVMWLALVFVFRRSPFSNLTLLDRQCTFGAFEQTLLQWISNKCYIFCVCVCSLSYSACNAHAPYCDLCTSRSHSLFYIMSFSGVPRNFVRGGGSTNSVEDRGHRERGSGGGSLLVRGSGDCCNLVQEISFHIVNFS